MKHEFIKTGDADSYSQLEDRNGEVVLAKCRVCRCCEGELPTDCPGEEVVPSARQRIYDGDLDFKNGAWRHITRMEGKPCG